MPLEERRSHMEQHHKDTSSTLRSGEPVSTKLWRIAEKARKEPKFKFTSLFHLMNKELLRECFDWLRGNAASGIDRMTKDCYGQTLDENLSHLVDRLHKMSYKPQPVMRVYIPKAGSKKLRPLGIPTLEDKLVQKALTMILESIYEQDFIADSYGFRPNKGCHLALKMLTKSVENRPTNHIVEADIKGFFDNISHEWLLKFLNHRIEDKRILRLVKRILRAGIIEDGIVKKGVKGTPQGAVCRPVLANVYLHYVLDIWFEKDFKKKCNGYACIIRYCDDFVVCFQSGEEALKFMKALEERLGKFELEIEASKSKILEFGRLAYENAKQNGRKPDTFDFLGFTHYCSTGRDGKRFRMRRKTSNKSFIAKLRAFKEWLKVSRTLPTIELIKEVNAKLKGHYGYYGVSDNYRSISRFLHEVKRSLFKWLNRRGKKNCLNWEKFDNLLKRLPLAKPRIMVNLF